MSDPHVISIAPPALRAAIARDLAPVRPLPPPLVRVAFLVPLALVLLVAAPLTFEIRIDLVRLGWTMSWGLSVAQLVVGLALMAAALQEAVPGRAWSRAAVAGWIALAFGAFLFVMVTSWFVSPTQLHGGWWGVSALCLMGSTASALPAVALGSILAARAWPTRPAIVGALVGLGAGLLSDAGWRLFCHFSEPSHVLAGHLGGILVAALIGVGLTQTLRQI